MQRRELLRSAGLGAGMAMLGSAAWPDGGVSAPARDFGNSFDDPQWALRTWMRLQADLTGRVVYSFQGGMVYGFLPQGDDVDLAAFARALYGYRSAIVRRATLAADGTIRVRSRAWSFYADAETGEYLRELTNPYTSARVECPPRMSPVTEQVLTPLGPRAAGGRADPGAESSETDRPMRLDHAVMGAHIWLRHDRFSRFRPPDASWYKLEADFITCVARLEDFRVEGLRHIPNTTAHNLVAEWQTWMKMHGTPGHILFVGNGAHVHSPTELPEAFQAAVAREFPGTLDEALRWKS